MTVTVRVRESDGRIEDPGNTKVKKGKDTVKWDLEGDGELKITFRDSPFGDPPGEQPSCEGGSCEVRRTPREGSERPPAPGLVGRLYKYDIEVTRGGRPFRLDPNVEVIP